MDNSVIIGTSVIKLNYTHICFILQIPKKKKCISKQGCFLELEGLPEKALPGITFMVSSGCTATLMVFFMHSRHTLTPESRGFVKSVNSIQITLNTPQLTIYRIGKPTLMVYMCITLLYYSINSIYQYYISLSLF